jgi:hypothetical protein
VGLTSGGPMSYANERPKIEGLASLACLLAEQGWDEAEARRLLIKHSRRNGTLNQRDLRRSAAAVDALPRPLAEDIANMPPLTDESEFYAELPVTSATEVRAARESGRRLLLRLAHDVEAGEIP